MNKSEFNGHRSIRHKNYRAHQSGELWTLYKMNPFKKIGMYGFKECTEKMRYKAQRSNEGPGKS